MEEQAFLQAAPSFWYNAQCIAVSSRGASRGIATLWDPSKVEIVSSATSPHWIFTKILLKDSNLHLSLFNVYVPIALSEKQFCWTNLNDHMITSHLDNFVIAGDLNLILSFEEK